MANDPRLFNHDRSARGAPRLTGSWARGISPDTIMNINKAVVLDGKYGFDGNT